MRGVVGLELEVLIAKNNGVNDLLAECDTPLWNAFVSLQERGLLRIAGRIQINGREWEVNEITPLGKIVLIASLGQNG